MIELGISDNRASSRNEAETANRQAGTTRGSGNVIGSTPGDPLRLFSVVAVESPEDRGYRLTKSLGVDKDSYFPVNELSIP